MENYFDVLELSIDQIEGQDEVTIQSDVNSAHKRLYALTIGPYTGVPRLDEKTQAQWQVILNKARDTLIDPRKRRDHIAALLPEPVPKPDPVPQSNPMPAGDGTLLQQSVQRVAKSGFSVAAIALVTRLIIQQFGNSGWLAGTGFTEWEYHWKWGEWFQWPWFEWKVSTLSAPWAGGEFIIAFASLGAGLFAYWHFFLKKKRVR